MNNVKSPLDSSVYCRVVKKIKVSEIILKYQLIYDINVSRFFNGMDEIYVYECEKTKYKFYYPFNIDGDSGFYEHLQKGIYYYVPWKWEHEVSMKYINKNDKILEVGSGGNGFVKKLTDKGYSITGLELNTKSISNGLADGLHVLNETIQNHSTNYSNYYDIVCSYQVLEHIAEPYSFVEGKIRSLKKGGKMLICVPNNDAYFLKHNHNPPLNMPPHHMGLWQLDSLSYLSKLFNLNLLSVEYETLQHYHVEGFSDVIFIRWVPNRYLRYILRKMGFKKVIKFFVDVFKNKIQGHSIFIVFEKQ